MRPLARRASGAHSYGVLELRGRERFLFAVLIGTALLLAAAVSLLGFVAGNALRQRDRAVREGALLLLSHEIELALREGSPAQARAVLQNAMDTHRSALAGVELSVPSGVIASVGKFSANDVITSLALGPVWRPLVGDAVVHFRGRPPFRLRLSPGSALGDQRRLSSVVVAGSAGASLALFVFAVLAARGLIERQRRQRSDSEKRELEIAALAGAGLAHRIRTPLATIKGTAQLLEKEPDAAVANRAARVVRESERIDIMIRRLLEFARPPEPEIERFDIAALVRRIAAGDENLRVSGLSQLDVLADPAQVETVLDELIANARASSGGRIEVGVEAGGGEARIEVRDRGPGLSIAPERAFDPYVTTRVDGVGLGLPIARSLARANGGDLLLRNRGDGGCIAELRLGVA